MHQHGSIQEMYKLVSSSHVIVGHVVRRNTRCASGCVFRDDGLSSMFIQTI
ncbi:hypothetical protein Syun_023907 [Stephania yunnanensis]|uniref:Uncharacterized protein n=1 Tax=Stephania yunnanensis TaxID=152371 RepID=A0AAP0I3L0_9MAGN